MRKFKDGKAYHGSEEVSGGRLTGTTDTDYFYFFCPRCPAAHVLQILDFAVLSDGPVEYAPEARPGAVRDFVLVFKLRCARCGLVDFTKLCNFGWPGGNLLDTHGLRGKKIRIVEIGETEEEPI